MTLLSNIIFCFYKYFWEVIFRFYWK